MRRIFISHRRIKGKVASTTRMIANLLRKSLYNKVFLDVDENYATQFPNKLREEIQKCDICILVLPDDGDISFLYQENNWVRKEIELAMKYDKPIVPIITKQDFQWPTDLPESIKGLSHNEEGVYGGLNICYYNTNDEKKSIQSIRYIIKSLKPQNPLHLIFGHVLLTLLFVCILLLGIGCWGYNTFYPYTESQANELFNEAGRQNAEGYPEEAAKNYKKIADFLKKEQLYNNNYFISRFMHAELTKENIPSGVSIALFKELIDETQNFKSSATVWEVNRKAMFMLGRIYNQLNKPDSCVYYFYQVKPYFEQNKDWHITEINYTLDRHKDFLDKNALYQEGMRAYNNQDFELAFQYFMTAAKQGQLDAQAMVGVCYARGEGVELDYAEADKWFQTAAKFGNNIAQYNMGISYYNNKKFKEAVEWFLKAAQNSTPNRLAMKMLYTCYANGLGVEKDLIIANEWLMKSQK